MPILLNDKYHNDTMVDQYGTDTSIQNKQTPDLPPVPMLPNASKGPEAVMQAIDEWFDYQDHLKALGITMHSIDSKHQPEPHKASPISLQQNASKPQA